MSRRRSFGLLAGLVGVVALCCATLYAAFGPPGRGPGGGAGRGPDGGTVLGRAEPAPSEGGWTGTWAATPAGAEPGAPDGHPRTSLRTVVHTSIGGSGARITLSNLYGTRPLRIGRASIAVGAGAGAGARTGTMRPLTFGGRAGVTVPPGGRLVGDPVRMKVPADTDLLVTLYTPGPGGPVTYRPRTVQTSYLAPGDHTEDLSGSPFSASTQAVRYLTAVEVLNREARGTVVAFGDSLVSGEGSLRDANHRWPDVLADRLRGRRIGVLNAGLGANMLLRDGAPEGGPGGQSRFGRDVLERQGVTAVVVSLGINDVKLPAEPAGARRRADRITAGLKDLTRRAHARGLVVVGSTLTPFGTFPGHNAVTESVRDRVNEAIRAGGVFDRFVDFDRVLHDPHSPDLLDPAYDSGDGLHPNDAGYRAMGLAFDLRDLEGSGSTGR